MHESHEAKKITYAKNIYIDLQIFLKIFHCDLSCMSTYFLIFHDQYCFNLCNLQDSGHTWKGGGIISKMQRYPKGQSTDWSFYCILLKTVTFLMWTYALVLYLTPCNTCISTFIAPFGDTFRIFQAEFMYPGRTMKMQKTWLRLTIRKKEHTVFNNKKFK